MEKSKLTETNGLTTFVYKSDEPCSYFEHIRDMMIKSYELAKDHPMGAIGSDGDLVEEMAVLVKSMAKKQKKLAKRMRETGKIPTWAIPLIAGLAEANLALERSHKAYVLAELEEGNLKPLDLDSQEDRDAFDLMKALIRAVEESDEA